MANSDNHVADADVLVNISVRIPAWVEKQLRDVGRDCDLVPGETYRIVLTKMAEFFYENWRRGPALSAFLEHLKFSPEQYNIFFDKTQ
jgi:hypothetical protein